MTTGSLGSTRHCSGTTADCGPRFAEISAACTQAMRDAVDRYSNLPKDSPTRDGYRQLLEHYNGIAQSLGATAEMLPSTLSLTPPAKVEKLPDGTPVAGGSAPNDKENALRQGHNPLASGLSSGLNRIGGLGKNDGKTNAKTGIGTTAPLTAALSAVGNVVAGAGEGERPIVVPEVDVPLREGTRFFRSGDYAKAEQYADMALQADPRSPDALNQRALSRLRQGRLDEARRDAEAVLRDDPGNEAARETLAYIRSMENPVRMRQPLVRPDFGSGLSAASAGPGASGVAAAGPTARPGPSAPGYPAPAGPVPSGPGFDGAAPSRPMSPSQALVEAGRTKLRINDLRGALLDFSRAIDAEPRDNAAWADRAFVLNRLGDHAAALQDAEQSLRLRPDSPHALRERGYAHYKLGNYQAALADLVRAVAMDPKNAMGYFYRAQVLERLGRAAEAVADYTAAAVLDPGLKVLVGEALARLGAAGRSGPAGPARNPWKLVLWTLMVLTAAALVVEGIKRVARPGWVTSPAPASQPAGAAAPRTLGPQSLVAGNYRVLRELGRGGMGVVYEAEDATLKRAVALKQLGRQAAGDPELKERFLKEAQTAAKLKHPNLAQIYTAVAQDDELYLVFEYVDGQPLDKLLSLNGRIPLAQAKRVVADVCRALECAHGQRIIHRDLKPANVMLEKGGSCKVMDFGIAHEARTVSEATQTAAWGTPPYMAPEQEMGRVSRESDLYALAVMAYEMLAGTRPFTGGAYLLEKKLKKDFAPVTRTDPALPPAADAFFAKALEPEAEKRFRTAEEFARAFAAL